MTLDRLKFLEVNVAQLVLQTINARTLRGPLPQIVG